MNSARSTGAHGQIDSVMPRIASLELAVALLADLIREKGLAEHAKIARLMRRSAGETLAAAVVKRLAEITILIERTAAREPRPALRIVGSTRHREAFEDPRHRRRVTTALAWPRPPPCFRRRGPHTVGSKRSCHGVRARCGLAS